MSDDKISLFEQMRKVTELTGQIYDAQVTTLKRVAVVLFGHPVTVTVSHNKEFDETSQSKQIQGVVIYHTTSTPDPRKEEVATQAIEQILGRGWDVKVSYNEYRDTEPSPSPAAQSKRAKSVRPVRRKRKAAAKSKHRR